LWKNLFCESRWQYYRVAPLEENEIRFYLKQCAGGDWYPQMQSSHSLLAIPRFLRLICGLIHRATTGKDGEKARQIAVENLRVTTPAEVYCKAFFETGDEWDADSDPDTLGLLAQGLNDKAARIGLNDDEVPLPINRRRRVEQAAAILGVIAFEMYPRFSGVKLHSFQGAAAARAVEAGVASQATFERELLLLKEMNVHALDFLLFRESNEHRLAFRDRTTMAFFAAYWACRYEKPKKLEITRTWVVDDLFGMNQEHQEFWQFAAEMPDTGMPKNDRDETDESRWLALFAPLYDGSVKDDNGPIRSTEFIYRSWKRMEASPAGRRIIKEQYQAKTISQELLSGFIPLATGELPGDSGTFQMGDEFYARAVALQPFYLHQFCVPNTCYELFDPRHCVRRWVDNHSKSHRAVSELNDSAADDACPVVFVSWYDAVCFTKWLGNFIDNSGCYYKVTLPLEAQWEYACRAGRTTSYTFDELHLGATCTSDFCNFAGEDLDEYKYRGCTVPVDGSVPENWSAVLKIKPVKGPNRWGFY
jgi:formylglycine-generating enzyme required for sulfatase activity